MEVPTLTIACHEGPRPADDIFLYDGCRSQYLLDLLAQIPAVDRAVLLAGE
jgi:hypothetical protein